MKFLLFLALVMLAVWLWRSGRRGEDSPGQGGSPPRPPQDMVRCARCGVHLPLGDAVIGRVGLYCSDEHQRGAEP